DFAHLGEARGGTVGRQAHHFVFVAIMGKAEILRYGLIKYAERMWEMHPAFEHDIRPAPDPPGGAGEIAEPVDRDDDRLLEWRNVESGREMRQMMLDRV